MHALQMYFFMFQEADQRAKVGLCPPPPLPKLLEMALLETAPRRLNTNFHQSKDLQVSSAGTRATDLAEQRDPISGVGKENRKQDHTVSKNTRTTNF